MRNMWISWQTDEENSFMILRERSDEDWKEEYPKYSFEGLIQCDNTNFNVNITVRLLFRNFMLRFV